MLLLPSPTTLLLCTAPYRPWPVQMATPDPFRPARPPLEPMVINAVQKLLCSDQAAEAVAEQAVLDRAADPDYALSDEEQRQLRWQVLRVGAAAVPLVALLEGAVQRTPWVVKYGASNTFGVGDAQDPYVRACRAECMLAALILHADAAEVNFIDEERLEVLRDAPTDEDIAAVRAAAATATTG